MPSGHIPLADVSIDDHVIAAQHVGDYLMMARWSAATLRWWPTDVRDIGIVIEERADENIMVKWGDGSIRSVWRGNVRRLTAHERAELLAHAGG